MSLWRVTRRGGRLSVLLDEGIGKEVDAYLIYDLANQARGW